MFIFFFSLYTWTDTVTHAFMFLHLESLYKPLNALAVEYAISTSAAMGPQSTRIKDVTGCR
jgi:hypothetical protein